MVSNLIVVKQLPVIEEQLKGVKAKVETRVQNALALACTEETRSKVKAERSALNKEFAAFEARRKEVRASIMAPYETFEAVYKECVGNSYQKADAILKSRIDEVENGVKQQKAAEVSAYFEEYRASLGIPQDFIKLSDAKITITLSESLKSLKSKVQTFLNQIASDLVAIESQEYRDEILVEYKQRLNLSEAITAVSQHMMSVKQERQRREQAIAQSAVRVEAENKVKEVVKESSYVAPPVVATPSEPEAEIPPKTYSTSFRVIGTIDEIRALKNFLIEGGYTYEQL